MKRPIIGIGIDSADPVLMERWMAQGHLKNLRKLKEQGVFCLIENTVNQAGHPVTTCSTERLWSMTWTSCRPDKTGFWDTTKFFPEDYHTSRECTEIGVDFKEYPPFYAVGENYKVSVLDLPASGLSDNVNGLQILAWGGHYPFTPSHSRPAETLEEINQKYGKNEVLGNDHGHWSDPKYARWLYHALLRSIKTRTEIAMDLMRRDMLDLFLMVFPETHSGGHDLLHLSHPDHPVYNRYKDKVIPDADPLLDIYEAVDTALGEILADVPADTYVFCFSIHGMGVNVTDLLSMAVVPELMYRYSFPGQVALAAGNPSAPPPPVKTGIGRKSWAGEVWVLNDEPNPLLRLVKPWLPKRFMPKSANGLVSPWELGERKVRANWMPAMWYSDLWPRMKAFGLPGFADGHIRINLKGRDRNGVVDPADYDAVCQEITDLLTGLTNARTGEPCVDKVVRTRRYPTEDQDRDRLPGPDLIAIWNKSPKQPADVADSPQLGRIGPFPHARPGGHRSTGFLMASGPGIEAGKMGPTVEGVDIGPTLLTLMGAPVPAHLDGVPIADLIAALRHNEAA